MAFNYNKPFQELPITCTNKYIYCHFIVYDLQYGHTTNMSIITIYMKILNNHLCKAQGLCFTHNDQLLRYKHVS